MKVTQSSRSLKVEHCQLCNNYSHLPLESGSMRLTGLQFHCHFLILHVNIGIKLRQGPV